MSGPRKRPSVTEDRGVQRPRQHLVPHHSPQASVAHDHLRTSEAGSDHAGCHQRRVRIERKRGETHQPDLRALIQVDYAERLAAAVGHVQRDAVRAQRERVGQLHYFDRRHELLRAHVEHFYPIQPRIGDIQPLPHRVGDHIEQPFATAGPGVAVVVVLKDPDIRRDVDRLARLNQKIVRRNGSRRARVHRIVLKRDVGASRGNLRLHLWRGLQYACVALPVSTRGLHARGSAQSRDHRRQHDHNGPTRASTARPSKSPQAYQYSPSGALLLSFGPPDGFFGAFRIAIGPTGAMYVSEQYHTRITRFQIDETTAALSLSFGRLKAMYR